MTFGHKRQLSHCFVRTKRSSRCSTHVTPLSDEEEKFSALHHVHDAVRHTRRPECMHAGLGDCRTRRTVDLRTWRTGIRPQHFQSMNNKLFWLFTTLTLTVTLGAKRSDGPHRPAAAAVQAVRRGPFDAWWREFLEHRIGHASAGYAWVVLRRGQVLAAGGSGAARSDSAGRAIAPMLPGTRMQIASVSKPITAMALLLAMHERGISVDTPVVLLLGDSLGPFGNHVREITVRQLLTHRTGIPFGYIYSPRLANTREFLAGPIPNPPGDSARYSNINFSLARTVLEAVTGQSYAEYVVKRLLAPSGITDASLRSRSTDAFAHRFAAKTAGAPLAVDFEDEGGAYGWYMSAEDLAKWGAALQAGRLLPPQQVQQAFDGRLGFGQTATPQGPSHGHQGEWNIEGGFGVRTAIALFPDSVVAVLFVNTDVPFGPPQLLNDAYASAVPAFSRTFTDSGRKAIVHIAVPSSASEIRYTLDGSDPNVHSRKYVAPLEVTVPVHVRAQGFTGIAPSSFIGDLRLESVGSRQRN